MKSETAKQVIDYGIAGLCLPTLGIVRQIPAEVAQGLLFCSRGVAGLLGNYKVTLQSYTADISSAEECPDNLAALGGAMVAGMCAGLWMSQKHVDKPGNKQTDIS